jgi:dipeptidyl aminopeptidase/acylaminoacyl peptidase
MLYKDHGSPLQNRRTLVNVRSCLVLLAALLFCGVTADARSASGGNGLIAYERTVGTVGVVEAFDPATGASRDLVSGGQPAWSPDGSKLAFVQAETVYVANADGTGAQAIGAGSWPSWSPDGTRLAVARYDGVAAPQRPQGTLQLNVIDLATLAESPLSSGSEDVLVPAWSPDGTTIAYATATGLDVFDTADSTTRELPVPRPPNGGASWSPDGKELAFLASNGQVWIASADGSGARQVTYTLIGPHGLDERPAWSPDGTRIAWTQNADLCVTDLAGAVRRLTYTPQSSDSVLASLPAWQPTAVGTAEPVAAAAVANARQSCDWNPGVRVELLPDGVTPRDVRLKAPQELVFVNHTTGPLTVTTTFGADHATIAPGDHFGFSTAPGNYTFTVAGYPDGPRYGTFSATAAGAVTIAEHASIRYGERTVLSGTAHGPAGARVVVWAHPLDASRQTQIAAVTPFRGGWHVSVSPRVATQYTASFAGAQDQRILRVRLNLRVHRAGHTVTAWVVPRFGHSSVLLFRFTPSRLLLWSGFRDARVDPNGVATFRNVPSGRYYVAVLGGSLYLDTASEPFGIGR